MPWGATGDAFVKETRRGLLDRVVGRTSRARRAHDASRWLFERGVPVPEPLACVEEGDTARFVARFVEGESLDRVLARALAAGDREEVLACALAVARLAARVHGCGVAHGDFKPANVLVAPHPGPLPLPRRGEGAPALEGSPGLVLVDLDAATITRGPPSRRARARDLAALDAYGQRGPHRVPRAVRRAALEAYLAAAPFETDGRALARLVLRRSLLKRARWARAAP